MGFGRAGWYSYDAIDMSNKSAWEIHPEWQPLVIGDRSRPTGGGFRQARRAGRRSSSFTTPP
jgi:hypothetical protein